MPGPYSDSSHSCAPQCPRCGYGRTTRVKRKGFMQTVIHHHFGKFPWECTGCRAVFLFKYRGSSQRRRQSTGEVRQPAAAGNRH